MRLAVACSSAVRAPSSLAPRSVARLARLDRQIDDDRQVIRGHLDDAIARYVDALDVQILSDPNVVEPQQRTTRRPGRARRPPARSLRVAQAMTQPKIDRG